MAVSRWQMLWRSWLNFRFVVTLAFSLLLNMANVNVQGVDTGPVLRRMWHPLLWAAAGERTHRPSVSARWGWTSPWSKLFMGRCRIAEQQPENHQNGFIILVGCPPYPPFRACVWNSSYDNFTSTSPAPRAQGQKKQRGQGWLLMSILTGKGCGISMRLSQELGREEGWYKDTVVSMFPVSVTCQHFQEANTANKPRLGANTPEGPAPALSLMPSLSCLYEQVLRIFGHWFPQW